MTKNKKNFIYNVICSGIIFILGVLYLSVPNYYGIDELTTNININNLFISFLLIYATIHTGEYYFSKENNNEHLFLTISCGIAALINIYLSYYIHPLLVISLSLIGFVFLISLVRLISIFYYKDKNDAYYYIESVLLVLFILSGISICFNLFNDMLLQTMLLGVFILVLGLLEMFDSSLKCLLKAKRFTDKIKLK